MTNLSAYQDLMTALATRRPNQSAADDERIVEAALAKHSRELAMKVRNWDAEAEGYTEPQMAVYAVADHIDQRSGQ